MQTIPKYQVILKRLVEECTAIVKRRTNKRTHLHERDSDKKKERESERLVRRSIERKYLRKKKVAKHSLVA